ncbi:RnfABCDGE type electron transport complex subunit D [Synechococcus sp. PCC 7336]|uniref:RnfABCDGE type electron transport complex subunit D n=1 Tax=Synechococcus sp. PCC 7336 TaxID=195250 RepID=UPI00034CADAF|nr:RnfABCDGE type electron transport complex subunit D [Synechococcus sp. PCC 7336]
MFLDARFYQIAFLSLFLWLGVGARDWTLRPDVMAAAVFSCAIVQVALVFLVPPPKPAETDPRDRKALAREILPQWKYALQSLPSAAITSLSLCLLLRANHPLAMAFAGGMAIASKFWLRAPHRKHFFNPANFGIVVALLLTGDVWVSPGQWGTDWWAVLAFAGAGGMVLRRVGRWDTSAAFLGVYAALEIARNFWLGWSWDVVAHHLTSGSLLLFALFMLTDPRSIPNARPARVVWAIAIALLTFVLRYTVYLPAAMFWALFILSPLTLWLDEVWPAERFQWGQKSPAAAASPSLQQTDLPQPIAFDR